MMSASTAFAKLGVLSLLPTLAAEKRRQRAYKEAPMTRSARIEAARQAHYQEPAPSSAEPDGGIDFAALGIEPRYLPALDGAQPYHRAPEAGRAAPISERRVAELVAEALEPSPGEAEDALSAALATPEGRRVLQDDPCEPGGDPFWTDLFGGAPKWDGAF